MVENLYDNYSYGYNTGWWSKYTTPTTTTTTKTKKGKRKAKTSKPAPKFTFKEYDPMREDAINAVLDAQYGFHKTLAEMVADVVWPDDPSIVYRHMDFRHLNPGVLDDALLALEAGEDIDSVLLSLFDELHVA